MRRLILLLSLTLFTLTALVSLTVLLSRAQPCRSALLYHTAQPSTSDLELHVLDADHGKAYRFPINTRSLTVTQSNTGQLAIATAPLEGYALYLWTPYRSLEVITAGQHVPTNPVWSPDGRLAYVSDPENHSDIFVLNPNGETQRISSAPTWEQHPVWSADGRLAFPTYAGARDSVWVMNREGELYRIGEPDQFIEVYNLLWSNEGRLAFKVQIAQPSSPGLYVLQPDGSTGILIERMDVFDMAWSPTDERLFFTGSTPQDTHHYILEADGTLTQLPIDVVTPLEVWWTPDGRIAFAEAQGSYAVIEANGSISTLDYLPDEPGITSPDGRFAAALNTSTGGSMLYIRDADGRQQTLFAGNALYKPYLWVGCGA